MSLGVHAKGLRSGLGFGRVSELWDVEGLCILCFTELLED